MILKYIDKHGRKVYQDSNNTIYKEIDGVLHTVTNQGEPLHPVFSHKFLLTYWSNGQLISYQGNQYRVGKMSYGDFFLEPPPERPETEPFNSGTLWLEKIPKTSIYKILD